MTGREVLPGVWHIQDNMGVCMTLLTGADKALLIDAGYGLEDSMAYIRTLTDKPVEVYLTHGHHDHALGTMRVGRAKMRHEDLDEFVLRTGTEQRRKVMRQAAGKGLDIPGDFLSAAVPVPEEIVMNSTINGFDATVVDPGGRLVTVIKVPGHTAGSVVVWSEKDRLLLTGDDWNPCTWLWFPCSTGVRQWRENMIRLISALPFEYVLCSHQPGLRTKEELRVYIDYLSDDRLKGAEDADMGSDIRTKRVRFGREYELVFDGDKF